MMLPLIKTTRLYRVISLLGSSTAESPLRMKFGVHAVLVHVQLFGGVCMCHASALVFHARLYSWCPRQELGVGGFEHEFSATSDQTLESCASGKLCRN